MANSVLSWLANPKNVGQMRDADGIGKSKSATCKDFFKLFIKVEKGKVVDTKFQTYGAPVSIAATSAVSEIIKGKTLDEALAVKLEDVLALIGRVDSASKPCVEDAVSLIASAINNYYKKQEKEGGVKPKAVKAKTAATVEEKKAEPKNQAVAEEKPVAVKASPEVKSEVKEEEKSAAKEEKAAKAEPNITVLTKDSESGEVEVDIFSEIDAITAKISEAVNKMKKN